jgi:hypothetical protein
MRDMSHQSQRSSGVIEALAKAAAGFGVTLLLHTSSILAQAPVDGPPPPPWTTRSASGAEVELLGVASAPVSDGKWWKPDGTPHDKPMPQLRTTPNDPRAPEGMRGYTLIVRSGHGSRQLVAYPEVASPGQVLFRRGIEGHPLVQEVVVAVPHDWTEVDFGFGITLPPRLGYVVFEVAGEALHQPHVHDFKERGSLRVSELAEVAGRSQVVVEFTPGKGDSIVRRHSLWRRAILPDGSNVLGRPSLRQAAPDGKFSETWTFDVRPDEIVRLVLRARPYEYTEFRHISLEPGKATLAEIIPLAPAEMDAASKSLERVAPATNQQ